MAEPTLKDVLSAVVALTGAVGRLEKGQASLEKGQAALEKDLADLRTDVAAHRTETAAHRAETAASFAMLEEELANHSDPVHKYLEADIVAIHRGLVRAKVPGIPKDLPSQVRAKGERRSKPAARAARRRPTR